MHRNDPEVLFTAINHAQLLTRLAAVDTHVPWRTKGRKTHHRERFCTIQLLSSLSPDYWRFPITVIERDRPDLQIDMHGGLTIGIEHVEAASSNDQHMAALREQGYGPEVYFSRFAAIDEAPLKKAEAIKIIEADEPGDGWVGDSAERHWAKVILHFAKLKLASIFEPGYERFDATWLLIYDSWPGPTPNPRKAAAFLSAEPEMSDVLASFERVFVLRGERLWEFSCEAAFHVVKSTSLDSMDSTPEVISKSEDKKINIEAWIDETGGKGKLRNLDDVRDADFALFVALLIESDERTSVMAILSPAFELFRAHAPQGAKLHITDAFAENAPPDWTTAAIEARNMILDGLHATGPRIVYSARRFRVARGMHTLSVGGQRALKAAAEQRYAGWKFRNPDESGRVEVEAFRDLMSLLDVVGSGGKRVHPKMDRVDGQLMNEYQAELDELQDDGPVDIAASAFNVEEKVKRTDTWTLSTEVELPYSTRLTNVDNPCMVMDVGPELFAVDVIANALAKHLRSLPSDANLFGSNATKNWDHGALIRISNDNQIAMFGLC